MSKAKKVSTIPTINPALPRVAININGKQYHLQFDFNALARAEEISGLNMFASLDFSHLSVTKLRAMLFASLLRSHPEITLEEAGALVNIHTLPEITTKMVEAWHGSLPEIKDEDEKGNAVAEAE